MKLLANIKHKSIGEIEGRIFERRASRAIVLRDQEILLLYTKRYNDYSFPGGGIDPDEELISGLKRELEEETGAQNIKVVQEFGYVDEYRPHNKPDYDLIHMISYFYVCEINSILGKAQMQHYEIENGMIVKWINIHEAISHNKNVINSFETSMGLSIERETLVLEMVVANLLNMK